MRSFLSGRRSAPKRLVRVGPLAIHAAPRGAVVSDNGDAVLIITPPPPLWSRSALIVLPLFLLGVCWRLMLSAEPTSGALAPLPRYSLELAGAHDHRITRAARVAHLRPDALMDLVLRPQHPVTGAVQIGAYLGRERRLQPWAVHPVRSASGAFHLRAPLAELPDLGGAAANEEIEIIFTLARPAGGSEVVLRTWIRIAHE